MVLRGEIEKVLQSLEAGAVSYLLVGGIAVNLHGRRRNTSDIDILTELSENNLAKLESVIKDLGYLPRQPINLSDAADPNIRESWIRDKGAVALFFQNPKTPYVSLDILYDVPINYNEAYERRVEFSLPSGPPIKVCSIEDLIELKRFSPRQVDQEDVESLEVIREFKRREKDDSL